MLASAGPCGRGGYWTFGAAARGCAAVHLAHKLDWPAPAAFAPKVAAHGPRPAARGAAERFGPLSLGDPGPSAAMPGEIDTSSIPHRYL